MNNENMPSFWLARPFSAIISFDRDKFLGLVVLFMMSVTSVMAQEVDKTIKDSISVKTLDEVIVVAGTNYQVQQSFSNVETFNRSVQLQQTSPGQISPYLGGFTGNQVDQVVNGIRFNNALFRTGPNQYFGWVPLRFTKSITTSDGGNIGGTISREIGIDETTLEISYDGGTNGSDQYISYKDNKFGVAINNIIDGNLRSVKGETPHSSYNQKSLLGEYNWSTKNKTLFLISQSDGLERTDKWNGGERINGFQNPSVYTWDLQRYVMLNHTYIGEKLILNGAYQNFTENILNKSTEIKSRLNSITLNGEYFINGGFSLYSSNVIENIDYQTQGVDDVPNNLYSTYKQGLRFNRSYNGYNLTLSGGYKTVTITDINPFKGFETSMILGRRGFFVSYSNSLNAPSYLMVKQGITTGKAEQLPNENLKQETVNSYRVGYKKKNLYVDVNYRRLNNTIGTIFITPDTIQTVNQGFTKVWSSNLSYNKENILNTGFNLDYRSEFIYGITSEGEPINKVVPFRSYLRLDKKGVWFDWTFQTKDDNMSENDLNDVRQFSHNKGVNVMSVGYNGKLKKFEYGVSLFNILNNESRIVGSSVDLPRRSLMLNFKYKI